MSRITLTPDTSPYSPDVTGAVAAPRSAACLNCDTPLAGPYCHACGQRDIPPYPSTRELVVDAFWELSGWDGRFASTVRALVEKPGMLTREFLEGRRARYLSPLRLYLLASLAYFLIAAGAPQLTKDTVALDGLRVSADVGSRPQRVGKAASLSLQDGQLTAEQKAAAVKDAERAPALMRPFLKKVIDDPKGFRRGMLETMPRMLFGLLPVFALIVALFYRGRKYPEHLYFAIHLHSFFFVALAVAALGRFTHVVQLAGFMGGVALLAMPIYSTMAFRRVYGGSLGKTLAKGVGIASIYSVLSLAALILMIYWVSIV